MSRRLSAVALSVCCMFSITASAQSQGQSPIKTRGIVLEISIIETMGAQYNEIAKMETSKDQLDRLMTDGKARLVAFLQVRTRTGESFIAKMGERVPIHTATLPAIRTSDRTSPSQSQSDSVGIPQFAYENTGLTAEGASTAVSDGLLDIRLKIEMTGLDRSTGRFTPTFTLKTFTDVVRMKESETALLMGFVQQQHAGQLSLEQIASGSSSTMRGGFVVLLTTKPVQ